MYEPLLDDIHVETLKMEEDDYEVETGSRDELRGVEQDPALKDEGRLAARETVYEPHGRKG